MYKRFRWVFLVMAVVVATMWLALPRFLPKLDKTDVDSTGLGSDRKISADRPATRNSDPAEGESAKTGGEADKEITRESPRHSAGEVEKYQMEERRISRLKAAVREQEDKVEEKRRRLASIVRTVGVIYKVPDANHADKAGSAKPEGTQVKPSPADLAEDAAKRAQDAQAYVDAKRDFETDWKLLEEMKLKLSGEQVKPRKEDE
jgi:hypothetical protein